MLPKDTKQRRETEAAGATQSTLDGHLREKPAVPERVVKYTDALFREAAIEWLVSTDQVSNSLVAASLVLKTLC